MSKPRNSITKAARKANRLSVEGNEEVKAGFMYSSGSMGDFGGGYNYTALRAAGYSVGDSIGFTLMKGLGLLD